MGIAWRYSYSVEKSSLTILHQREGKVADELSTRVTTTLGELSVSVSSSLFQLRERSCAVTASKHLYNQFMSGIPKLWGLKRVLSVGLPLGL